MRHSLSKVFSPALSSRFPPGKHECVNSLHHQVRGGSEAQRLKSICFWQPNLCHCASHFSPAPWPGSRPYHCWRRQNKPPRASLEERGKKNILNSLGGNKKRVFKINLRIQSVTQLLCPRPSPRFPQQNVNKHILWPRAFHLLPGR